LSDARVGFGALLDADKLGADGIRCGQDGWIGMASMFDGVLINGIEGAAGLES